jgi:hypothetical protein
MGRENGGSDRMKIDHAEAMQRARDYLVRNNKFYAGTKETELLAALILQAVEDALDEEPGPPEAA